jgi:hypothetical protein
MEDGSLEIIPNDRGTEQDNSDNAGNPKKRRGRPKGSKNRITRISVNNSSDSVRTVGEPDRDDRDDSRDAGADTGSDSGREDRGDRGTERNPGTSATRGRSSNRRTSKTKTRMVPVSEEVIRLLLIQAANFHRQVTPPIPEIRELWTIPEEEIFTLSAPLAKTLADLPDKYLQIVESGLKLVNPLMVVTAAYAIIVPRKMMEKRILNELRTSGRIYSEGKSRSNSQSAEDTNTQGDIGNFAFYQGS